MASSNFFDIMFIIDIVCCVVMVLYRAGFRYGACLFLSRMLGKTLLNAGAWNMPKTRFGIKGMTA